jgi:DNA-binding HxlR family transcriptional regulator
MNETSPNAELVAFFKAMADSNRLKIIGLLANKDYTVEQLSALCNILPSTVSHHLNRLSEVGLVSARADGYYSVYRLEKDVLEGMAKHLLAVNTLPALAQDVDLSAYDNKILHDYLLPDGRLKTIPSQRKKLEAVLRYLVEKFEVGKTYPEKEVNAVLARFHEDTATLRRELIGYHLMERKNGEYWRL